MYTCHKVYIGVLIVKCMHATGRVGSLGVGGLSWKLICKYFWKPLIQGVWNKRLKLMRQILWLILIDINCRMLIWWDFLLHDCGDDGVTVWGIIIDKGCVANLKPVAKLDWHHRSSDRPTWTFYVRMLHNKVVNLRMVRDLRGKSSKRQQYQKVQIKMFVINNHIHQGNLN